jgi:protein gp37
VAGLSDIEWTDATWNPVSGCRVLSPGCTHCYAMRMAARLQAMGHPIYEGVTRKSGGRPKWTGRLHFNEAALEIPLRWRKPRRIFVNSMSDLFQDGVPDAFIARVWGVMAQAKQHTFQILTKRPENMLRILGTSVESAEFSPRIEILRQVPAQVRFISFEPLIGAIGAVNLSDIHWAIVGGESGPRSRAMEARWVEELHTQCRKQKVAFFFKQWGGVNKKAAGRTFRRRTWDEYPNRLQAADA